MYELAIWSALLTNIYLFNPKSCQTEICSFFYQVQAAKCAMFKACTGVFMLKCTAAALLSCRSPHRVRVVCMVKVLDTLFVQGLKGDITSIEARVLSSTPGNKELKKWEPIRIHEQGLIVTHVSQEVLEGGKGRQLWCETDVPSCILVSPGLSRPLEREIWKSKALSSLF